MRFIRVILILGTLSLVLNSGCKARRAAGSGALGQKVNVPGGVPVDGSFDWGKAVADAAGQPGNNILPLRQLTYCFHNSIQNEPLLMAAFSFSAQRVQGLGTGWTLAAAPGACTGNENILVMAGNLGQMPAMQPGDVSPTDVESYEPDYPSESQQKRGANPPFPRAPGGSTILGIFKRGGSIMPGQKFIEEGIIAFNNDPSVIWSEVQGANGFDPNEVAMHEIGHALRLDHESFAFSDDEVAAHTGMSPGKDNPVVKPGPDGKIQTAALGDDAINNGVLDAGGDGFADSGKPTNVMEPFAVYGRHGVNPLGVGKVQRYNYSTREALSLAASAAN